MTMPLAWRPFVDPVDLFAGPGWLWFLPPLLLASALVYHAVRGEDALPWPPLLRRAAWTSLKALLALGAALLILWWT